MELVVRRNYLPVKHCLYRSGLLVDEPIRSLKLLEIVQRRLGIKHFFVISMYTSLQFSSEILTMQ